MRSILCFGQADPAMQSIKPSSLIDFVYKPIELVSDTFERKLGMASVVIISLSAMLGSGLFVLPALAMLDMGGGTVAVGGIWLAYLLAAFIVLPGAISKGELATAMPSSGGSYVYVERTFGSLIGTISGLGLSYLSNCDCDRGAKCDIIYYFASIDSLHVQ